MTRLTPSTTVDLGLEDDEFYQGVLKSWQIVKGGAYGDQLEVVWEGRQGLHVRDKLSLKLGEMADGTPSKLRQMLNALAEKPKGEELWFDPDTFEWGYDLDGADATPGYAVLTAGMACQFAGQNKTGSKGGSFYNVKRYRSLKAKRG